MGNQPNDSKSRAIEVLETLLHTSEAQTAVITDLANEIGVLINLLTSAAQNNVKLLNAAEPGQYQDFDASAIIMTYSDKGEPAYKIIGFPFNTFGVRVWPEILPQLGIDPATLKPGPNPYAARVRAKMVESSTVSGKLTPKKIIGLAPKEV